MADDSYRIEKYDWVFAARYIDIGTRGQVVLVNRPFFGSDTYNVIFAGDRAAVDLREEDIAKVGIPPEDQP